MSTRQSLLPLALLATAALGGPAFATGGGTPDGLPPPAETVCGGETGKAKGLCTAYCEAMDCDSANHTASQTACNRVRANFQSLTGHDVPCEMVTCPCAAYSAWTNVLNTPIADQVTADEAYWTSLATWFVPTGINFGPICSGSTDAPTYFSVMESPDGMTSVGFSAAAVQGDPGNYSCVAVEGVAASGITGEEYLPYNSVNLPVTDAQAAACAAQVKATAAATGLTCSS